MLSTVQFFNGSRPQKVLGDGIIIHLTSSIVVRVKEESRSVICRGRTFTLFIICELRTKTV